MDIYLIFPQRKYPRYHSINRYNYNLFYIYFEKRRNNKIKYNFEVLSIPIFILKILLISSIVGYLFWILASYNGLSWTFVIVLIVTFIYHIMTTKRLWEDIYAVGGNPEAAKLSGISLNKITLFVFGSMGLLTALSGILYASRFQSATLQQEHYLNLMLLLLHMLVAYLQPVVWVRLLTLLSVL